MQVIHISMMTMLQLGFLTHATNAIEIKCSNTDKWFSSVPRSRCTSYYRCSAKGQSERKECSPGSMFNFYQQECIRAEGNCYEPVCIGRSNGVYQDTTHACWRSFTCHNDRVVSIDNCPPKQMHNGQKCVHHSLVTCDLPEKSAVKYPFSGDRRCAGKPDGSNAINGNCDEFVVCKFFEVDHVANCKPNHHFHPDKRTCVPKGQVPNCNVQQSMAVINDFVCRNKSDGANIDPTSLDCATYVICRNGKLEAQKRCVIEAVFNGESCVPAPLYKCIPPATAANNGQLVDICYRKPNGLYVSPQHGCTSYVRCMSERTVEINECPSGHYFDDVSRTCVFERFLERRRCINAGKTMDCVARSNGFYQELDCRNYFYCYNGYKTQYKCNRDQLFNGESCMPQSQYSCPKTDTDLFCHERADGYYKDPNDGCRAYHFCSTGRKITYICAEGHTFDVVAKKCVPNGPISTSCKPDKFCLSKSDGYHADLSSNCRNYVYCQNSEKLAQLTCRDSNVFDGQKCISPLEYNCPSLYSRKETNCIPKHCVQQQCKRDGIFASLSSDCRDYYSCIGGKASKITCSPGKRFNGELCVPDDRFSCPILCQERGNQRNTCPPGGYLSF